MRRRLLFLVATVFVAGCGGGEDFHAEDLGPNDAAQADAGHDSGPDVASLDGSSHDGDAYVEADAQPDGSPVDSSLPDGDAGADTGPEVQPEAGADAQPDVLEEANLDALVESEPQPEAGSDAQVDSSLDVSPDAGSDAQPDGSEDAQPDSSTDAQPEGGLDAEPDGSLDAQPDVSDAAPDAPSDSDAGCVDGARKCIGPVTPGICSGGKWFANGGMCNFGCTGEGVCRCTYVNDPWIQTLVTVVNKPGAGCGSEIGIPNVEIDGMLYMPVQACGVDAMKVLNYQGASTLAPYAVVPSFDDMENLMVQRAPVTMTQCEDGQPFYGFERTYFTRNTGVSNCFWTSTSVGAWQKVILANGTVTQKPKTDLCQVIPQYHP